MKTKQSKSLLTVTCGSNCFFRTQTDLDSFIAEIEMLKQGQKELEEKSIEQEQKGIDHDEAI